MKPTGRSPNRRGEDVPGYHRCASVDELKTSFRLIRPIPDSQKSWPSADLQEGCIPDSLYSQPAGRLG